MTYHCIAPSHMKCYDLELSQCDHCVWATQQKEQGTMSVKSTKTTMELLEDTLKLALGEIRSALAEADIGEMDFEISATGRTMGGDLRVQFRLGDYGYRTQGGAVEPVLAEYLRRHGWNERNAPLCLPAASATTEVDVGI